MNWRKWPKRVLAKNEVMRLLHWQWNLGVIFEQIHLKTLGQIHITLMWTGQGWPNRWRWSPRTRLQGFCWRWKIQRQISQSDASACKSVPGSLRLKYLVGQNLMSLMMKRISNKTKIINILLITKHLYICNNLSFMLQGNVYLLFNQFQGHIISTLCKSGQNYKISFNTILERLHFTWSMNCRSWKP